MAKHRIPTRRNPELHRRLFKGPHVLNVVTRIGGVAAAIGKRDILPAAELGLLPQPVLQRTYHYLIRL